MTDKTSSHPVSGASLSDGVRIPVVYVEGTHYEMGWQIGTDRKTVIHQMLSVYRRYFDEERERIGIDGWDEAILHARKYLPFAEESVPNYVEELRGIADGAQLDFNDLLVLNCVEAITEDALHVGCTSLAAAPEVTADGSLLVGHNEDWLPDDRDTVYLVHARPKDEPAYLAITYGGLLPNIGFNQYGIAQCCDSVYPDDARIGVPRVFVSRAVLASRTLSEAIRAALNRRRAAGYNHLIVHVSGEMYNVEVSAQDFDVIYGIDGMLAHTNNYLSRRMRAIEKDSEELIASRVRYNRATRLMRSQRGKLSLKSFQAILSDHVNYPQSICNHIDEEDAPLERQQTIASLLMDLTAQTMYVAWGPPCQAEYYSYKLEA
ncbi:MAG: C45 family autoproteolytic acyltransferase/hydolase [Anaerolineae bacterium]